MRRSRSSAYQRLVVSGPYSPMSPAQRVGSVSGRRANSMSSSCSHGSRRAPPGPVVAPSGADALQAVAVRTARTLTTVAIRTRILDGWNQRCSLAGLPGNIHVLPVPNPLPNLASWHPQIVHFVVALLFVGLAMRLVAFTPYFRFTNYAATTLLVV